MTDDPLSLTALAARQQHPVSTSPAPPNVQPHYQPRAVQPILPFDGSADPVDEDDGEIACICAYSGYDDGYTIQCDTCSRWQHMECYYPDERDRPGDHQKHWCVDCVPREIDARKATQIQKKKIEDQQLANGLKRPATKGHRKKVKELPPAHAAAVNGWSADKHAHLHGRDRKSASPRDQPPPAKKPKTSHRPSASVNHVPTGRKRNGSIANNQHHSHSQSPGPVQIIPFYSEEFLNLYDSTSAHVDTETNLMNNLAVTSSLSEWLKDPDAVERATNGRSQNEVFLRWDGRFEDMPGRPEVALHWESDHRAPNVAGPVRFPCLTVQEEISERTFIGELRGHIGYKEDYMTENHARWPSLRHAEPFVFFHPQLPLYIDARGEGSIFRYVRRSCQPNAEIQTIITDGTNYHFCFMATKDIQPGDEVTIAWETDSHLRTMYSERSHNTGELGGDIKDHIALWVSNVLANCGPCACAGDSCLMSRFDRRGQPLLLEPAPMKVAKQRKIKTVHNNIASVEQNRNSSSRSGSEVRKFDHDEDMPDSRSVSGSQTGSASRDITPGTHYSAIIPEMSERERKKLMREEEMFRRQEQESGRMKKKRLSGGSNLNTPSASTSRQLGHSPTASAQKYTDAATSISRSNVSAGRTSSGKRPSRIGQSSSRPNTKSTSSSAKTPKPVYVNAEIQCDMDAEEAPAVTVASTPPKRKRYLSVTQRLLQRCATNNMKRKAEHQETKPMEGIQGDTMDIDKDESPGPDADTADILPLSPILAKTSEVEMKDIATDGVAVSDNIQPDATMEDAEEPMSTKRLKADTIPSVSQIFDEPSPPEAGLSSHLPTDPPPPPWGPDTLAPPNQQQPITRSPSPASVKSPHHRPDFHVAMPPPPLYPFTSQSSQPDAAFAQSPSTLTPGTLFSPAGPSSVNPSPARKKMSLSDYTRRSRARESEPSALDAIGESGGKEEVAVTDSPQPEGMDQQQQEKSGVESVGEAQEGEVS